MADSDSSCSHWWHAPIYVLLSAMLAFIAITTGIHSSTTTAAGDGGGNHSFLLSGNASHSLRRSSAGKFNIFAALLQISPELFLSPPQTTVFAVEDAAFSNASLPPWAIKDLLLYHTSPAHLRFQELLKIPIGNCLPTQISDKKIKITKIDQEIGSVEINSVKITHPDLFLGDGLTIHGVSSFFAGINGGKQTIESPNCDPENHTLEWDKIVQILSSNGFVSFAIGLYSVLDAIAEEHANLSSVTVLAPPSLGFLASPSPLLDKVVKLHLLPQKLRYEDLAALPRGASMKTLFSGAEVEIEFDNVTRVLAVGGVEITAPDVLQSKNFTVHGISRALGVYDQLLNPIV